MSVENLLQTPLSNWHAANNGRMVEFAGWTMPVQYGSIIEEHHQTRNAFGLFDVSHMGRLYFSGTDVAEFLDGLTTRRVARVAAGKIRYSLMTNEDGGILDDVLVYHLGNLAGENYHMMVVNASNRDKIVGWLNSHLPADSDIKIDDRTTTTAMIAVQGPKANDAVKSICSLDPDSLAYYTGGPAKIGDTEVIVSRTGYTGEDGCELIVPGDAAADVWQQLVDLGSEVGGGPAGLASRDTLRLEAAMPLYGHELNEQTNAAQTDLKFAINVKDRQFIGRSAILAGRKDPSLNVRVGIELKDRRPARENCPIVLNGAPIGVITSGTFSPTLQKSISMGYISKDHAAVGTEISIDIRGKIHEATIVELPFYRRPA